MTQPHKHFDDIDSVQTHSHIHWHATMHPDSMKAGNLSCEFIRNAVYCNVINAGTGSDCRSQSEKKKRRDEMKIRLYLNFSISFLFYSILFHFISWYSILFTLAFDGQSGR